MLFISSDGKENAWEVLARKCVVRWCCVLSFLDFGRIFIVEDPPSPECCLEQNTDISDMHKGARKLGLEIHLGRSELWHCTTSSCTCWTDDGPISPTSCLMYTPSFTLEFVPLHTKNSGWTIKATQHIEQKYSFKSFFVPFTLLLAAWCFLVHSWYQKQQHNFPYAYFLMCI